MPSHADFLFEIGTEELPAKSLFPLKEALLNETVSLLAKAQLTFTGIPQSFATPRRLALLIPGLQLQQQDQHNERKGPSVASAFDDKGNPTPACVGFAKSCGLTVDQLEKRDTPQGQWLYASQTIKGQATQDLLPALIHQALAKFPIPKPMRWGDHKTEFLRPVRWVVMLLGKDIIPAEFFGQVARNKTYGHRFMANHAITIKNPADYESLLMKEGKVVANFEKRKADIEEQLSDAAKKAHGNLHHNEALLTEVTGLVEWPVVLCASFPERFLEVPKNALIASMESHQKSFGLENSQGDLLPYFLTVSNIESEDPKQVIIGNQRVMNARLSDADFFYRQDLAIPLATHQDALKKMVFQAKLGTLYDKSLCLKDLAATIAQKIGVAPNHVSRAAELAKCDLRTHMVGEFPELQGEMGEIYATKQGENAEVAKALFEQYLPRFANDALPETQTGICLALADRLLNLVGIFGIGQIPTGDKDPFALRRAAIGVCRMITEKKLSLSLTDVLCSAQQAWQNHGAQFNNADTIEQVKKFILDRFKNLYLEQGISAQVMQAVMALDLDDLLDMDRRIQAVDAFSKTEAAASLAAAQKRVKNILQKENMASCELPKADSALFETEQEKTLAKILSQVQAKALVEFQEKNFANALMELAQLKTPVDAFFDGVMVMVENPAIRHNRLCLLAELSNTLNQVADISQLTN